MPSTLINITLYGFSEEFTTKEEKDEMWREATESAEVLADRLELSVSSVNVR